MVTSGIAGIGPETWSRLAESSARGDTLVARIAAPDVTNRLIAAVDSDGRRHLLVALGDEEVDLVDRDSRGIDVATRLLSIQGRDRARYIDISCNDAMGHAVFDLFGGEIASTLASSDGTPNEAILRLLAKWRRFWGHQPLQLLSRDEQLGLFAELWFLYFWLIPKVGADAALSRWRGPFGARHDFESAVESVEVKATAAAAGLAHRINGIDQLTPPENGTLFLFSLKVREEAGANNTFPDLVRLTRGACKNNIEALSHFENALAASQYLDAHEGEYSKTKFRIVSEKLFAVRDDFPRLTLSAFPSGIPLGVDNIAYDIDLQVALHLQIADNPETFGRQ